LARAQDQADRFRARLRAVEGELEITKRMLNAAQARVLDQGRQLATERAKLARAGVQVELGPGDSGERALVDLEISVSEEPAHAVKSAAPQASEAASGTRSVPGT
jgi:hypothetical protein